MLVEIPLQTYTLEGVNLEGFSKNACYKFNQ